MDHLYPIEQRLRRRHVDAAGFTLIELLVVLSIMALVALSLTPMLRIGRAGAEARAASDEMLNALRTTRSLAIARNRTTALVIDTRRNAYAEPKRLHALPRGMTMAWKNLVPVAGRDDQVAIYFFPDGSASGGEIDLTTGGAVGAVTVDWFTGLARVH
jgi:general secretion pathway protein H